VGLRSWFQLPNVKFERLDIVTQHELHISDDLRIALKPDTDSA